MAKGGSTFRLNQLFDRDALAGEIFFVPPFGRQSRRTRFYRYAEVQYVVQLT
jgi:hypothetical protein